MRSWRRRSSGRTGALLVGLLAASLLAACGGADDGRTRLTFVLFGDPVETAGYRTLVERFEREHPDVEVRLSPTATQADLLARLTTTLSGGQPPDVFLVNFRSYGQFAASGALEPVQPYLDASRTLQEGDFAEAPLDAFRFDGEQLTCMPQNASSLVVYYNEDLFAQAGLAPPAAGWTWDDFLRTAQALTRPQDGVYGLGTAPRLIRVAPFVWSNGGEVVDDEDRPTRLALSDGPAREALDFFLDLQLVHGVVPPDREEQGQDAEARFLDGRLGMLLSSRREVPGFRTIDGFGWDVGPLPVAPGGEAVTLLHSDAYCLAAQSEHHELAWELVELAMSREGQELLAATGRTVPSRLDVARSPAFLAPDAEPSRAEVFLDGQQVRATPHTASWVQVEKAVDDVLEDVFYGRVDRAEGLAQMEELAASLLPDRP